MQNYRSVQTAFRFRSDMIGMMKTKARANGLSLNRYVESLIERDLAQNKSEDLFARLRDIKVSPCISSDILKLSSFDIRFSKEELASDEKLSYILNK